jgi:kinesin family protein 6/9
MVAALSSNRNHIQESIQTCKFALTVGSVQNLARQNEKMDPEIEIARLREEVKKLRHQLAVALGQEEEGELDENEKEEIRNYYDRFVNEGIELPFFTPSRLQYLFRLMKERGFGKESKQEIIISDSEMKKNLQQLGKKLRQRENEIATLVNVLNQKKDKAMAWTQKGNF